MDKYKLFIKHSGEELIIKKLKDDLNKTYYDLIAEESHNGFKQFIITDDIMRSIILDYVINKNYLLISVETDDLNKNIILNELCTKMKNERANLALIMLELNARYLTIHNIQLKNNDEVLDISSNGVIATNLFVNKELINLIKSVYF